MKRLLILSTLFLLFQAVNGQSVQDKARLERERQEIQQELQAIQSEYNKLKKKSKASIGELTALQRKMEVQNKYIGNINREIRSINDDIYLSAVEINRMQVQLDTLKAQYARGVVYAYKNKSSYDFLNFLFSASSFNNALKRVSYLKSYRSYRQQQVTNILEKKKQIEDKKKALQGKQSQKKNALQNQQHQMAELETQKKEKATVVVVPEENKKNDSLVLIGQMMQKIRDNRIEYNTFSAKVNVDYQGGDGKKYDVNANVRIYKDSAIWISANAILGIEAMRVFITRDSVKLLDKLNKTYTARSVDYLQEVTALPLDLFTLQDLIIGNPVFLDSNIVSYSNGNNLVSLLSVGYWFKNLLTLTENDHVLVRSKLDDADISRNRTADLTYSDYEDKKGVPFSTKRRIVVAEKSRLDIKLDFKQYDFNQQVDFPFNIPKNYVLN